MYVLRSQSNGGFYIGATTRLRRRLDTHNDGLGGAFTTKHGPWELIAYERHATYSAARCREATLKRNARMRFLFIKRALAVSPGSAMLRYRQVGG